VSQDYIESRFDMLLVGPGELRSVGPETGRRPKNGIGRYRCLYGSTRYVFYVDGIPVSVLQCVSQSREEAFVSNVYTVLSYRRRGLARRLLARARRDFKVVKHAPDRSCSAQGKKWKKAVG
jgi:GNAT superfamily N-acetyltransferase